MIAGWFPKKKALLIGSGSLLNSYISVFVFSSINRRPDLLTVRRFDHTRLGALSAHHAAAAIAPPAALKTTTSQGGTRQMASSRNAEMPSAKSAVLAMPAFHTGL